MGAILKYAVTFEVVGVDIDVVGTILLIIGILGLVLSLVLMFMNSNRKPDSYERTVVQDDRYRNR